MKQRVMSRAGRTTRTGAIAMLGAVIALVFSVFLAATPAGAATETMNFTMTGSTQIGTGAAQPFPANSGFSATVDTTTGAVTNGHFSIPGYDIVSSGITIHIVITDTAAATGNIDQTTGVATITAHPKVTLTIQAGDPAPVCVIGPFTVVLKTSNAGGSAFTGNPLKGTLTANGYNVPAVQTTSTCISAIAGAINSSTAPGLGLPTTNTHQTSVLTATNQAITTTTAAPTTTAPATTTTAAPVNTNPNFTG